MRMTSPRFPKEKLIGSANQQDCQHKFDLLLSYLINSINVFMTQYSEQFLKFFFHFSRQIQRALTLKKNNFAEGYGECLEKKS